MLAMGSAPSNAASPQPELPVCKPVSQQSTLMWLQISIMYDDIWALYQTHLYSSADIWYV
jgi:hypothetical protein